MYTIKYYSILIRIDRIEKGTESDKHPPSPLGTNKQY